MFIFYLVCLIIGGGLLAFTLLMGGHGDSDVHSLDTHVDIAHQIDFDHNVDISHGIDTHVDVGSHADIHTGADHTVETHNGSRTTEAADAVKFISFRNAVYFTAFFGLTGTVLDLMSISSIITFLSSCGMGLFSAFVGYEFMKYLKSSETGEALDIYDLKGTVGTVVLNLSKEKRGKILVRTKDQQIELIAKASDSSSEEAFNRGDKVLIIEIKNNTAYVVPVDF